MTTRFVAMCDVCGKEADAGKSLVLLTQDQNRHHVKRRDVCWSCLTAVQGELGAELRRDFEEFNQIHGENGT